MTFQGYHELGHLEALASDASIIVMEYVDWTILVYVPLAELWELEARLELYYQYSYTTPTGTVDFA